MPIQPVPPNPPTPDPFAKALELRTHAGHFLPSVYGKQPEQPAGPPAPSYDPDYMDAIKAMSAYELEQGNIHIPPPQPKKPEGPDSITHEMIEHIKGKIGTMPPQQQSAAMIEAHDKLAGWMLDRKKFVISSAEGHPEIHMVNSPEEADTLAMKLLNDHSKAHDKQIQEQAEAAQKAEQERQESAPVARGGLVASHEASPKPAQQHPALHPANLERLTAQILATPDDERPQALLRAHDYLVEAMKESGGRFVGLDHQLHIIDPSKPGEAEELAQDWINQVVKEVDAQVAQQPAGAPQIGRPEENQQAEQAESGPEANPADQPVTEQTPADQPPADVAPQESAPEAVEQPKFKNGSTQIDVDPQSELGQAHSAAVSQIPDDHLMPTDFGGSPKGREDQAHITVRYGLKDDSPEAIDKIRQAVAGIQPFTIPVGKTDTFKPSEHSDGAAPVIAKLEKTPELLELRKIIEGAGDFKEDTFPSYEPHISIAYVRPELAGQYKGGNHLEGHQVQVDSITVSKRDGSTEVLPLGTAKPASNSDPDGAPTPVVDQPEIPPQGVSQASDINDLTPGGGLPNNPPEAMPDNQIQSDAAQADIQPDGQGISSHVAEQNDVALQSQKPEVISTETKAMPVPGEVPRVSDTLNKEDEAAIQGEPDPVTPAAEAKVGKEEPETERPILQPPIKGPEKKEISQYERLAAENAPLLETRLSQLASQVPGAQFARIRPQKHPERIEEKIEEGKPASTLSDFLAAQISCDTVAAKDGMVRLLKQNFKLAGPIDDAFLTGRKDKAGYPSCNLQLRLPNGATGECQLVPLEVQQATDHSHEFYRQGREAHDSGDKKKGDKLFAQADEINQGALKAFKSRNGIQ